MTRFARKGIRQSRIASFGESAIVAAACFALSASVSRAAEPSAEYRAAVELLTSRSDATQRTIRWTVIAAAAAAVVGTAALRRWQVVRAERRLREALRSAALDRDESPENLATTVMRLRELGTVKEIQRERVRRRSDGASHTTTPAVSRELFEVEWTALEGGSAGNRLLRAAALLQSDSPRSEELETSLRPEPGWTPRELGRAAELCRKAERLWGEAGWPLVYEILARNLAGDVEAVRKRIEDVRRVHLEVAISAPLRRDFLVCLVQNGELKKARALIEHLVRLTEDPDAMRRESGWIDALERSPPTPASLTDAHFRA